jgi:hypothetical protein
VDVEERDLVGRGAAVADRLDGDDDAIVVLKASNTVSRTQPLVTVPVTISVSMLW